MVVVMRGFCGRMGCGGGVGFLDVSLALVEDGGACGRLSCRGDDDDGDFMPTSGL